LLTQRMLRALATVDQPESVLAITFTRKAASEMRNRLLQALAESKNDTHDLRPHKVELHRLAHAVAERDAKLTWKLLDNPQRLQIRTVDSFCESVARQLPMLAGMGSEIEVTEDASRLYEAAADRTIALLADDTRPRESKAIATLLTYLDNHVSKLRSLLGLMLARRDQWLDKLGQSATLSDEELCELRGKLQDALARAIADELQSTRTEITGILGDDILSQLLAYIRIAADAADLGTSYATMRDLSALPAAHSKALPQWRAMRAFCLTGKGTLRARFNQKEGGLTGPAAAQCKEFFKETLTALPGAERLQELLTNAACKLPDPIYSDSEWEFVRALFVALPVAVANLLLVEAEQSKVDFVEVSMAANAALRTAEGPTELGLAMGARIRHVLIDEFQDTSVSQVKLLTSLVQGWEADEACSIFAVGDPMQSIYAFREAEVANFTGAVRDAQVAGVPAEPERLTANFRSQAGLIDWFNSVFPTVFASRNRSIHAGELLGTVAYNEAVASIPALEGEAVGIHGFAPQDYEAEAECVARLAEHALADKENKDVAILVRARSHLRHIVAALSRRGIPYRAVKIAALGARQTVLDLDALSRAMLNLADRTAWLAVLRAPWCGLTLADLWALCRGDRHSSIIDLLHQRMDSLSADGQHRARRVLATMESAIGDSGPTPLSLRVERAWIQLGAPAALAAGDRAAQIAEAHVFFELLEQTEAEQIWPGSARFAERLQKLFAPSDTSPGIRLDVMTIHNAKGLEWDTVIVPALGRPPQHDDKQLLYWRQHLRDGSDDLLLAPMQPPGADKDLSIEDYLRELLHRRSIEESRRLLYVAATRARRRLHLTATLPRSGKPNAASLLNLLWPVDTQRIGFQNIAPRSTEPYAEAPERTVEIRRLPSGWTLPEPPPKLHWEHATQPAADPEERHTFEWAGDARRLTGTVTHAFLQQIAREGLDAWDDVRVAAAAPSVRASLLSLGLTPSELNAATQDVLRALSNTISDQQGRWILSAHPEASSEFAITAATPEGTRNLRIDRTFVVDGVRWIIDFKTTAIEGGQSETFFDRQVEKYEPDLRRYHEAVQLLDPRPIKCALYFPLQKEWREVL
jgi:ATP-dependent exoDNAse (exonuclease V) beta subunit